jgi:hypothetical protein
MLLPIRAIFNEEAELSAATNGVCRVAAMVLSALAPASAS